MRKHSGRHPEAFDGAHEPTFEPSRFSRFGGRLVYAIAYERFKLRVWRSFHEHTGKWPIFSITFHYAFQLTLFVGCFLLGWFAHFDRWSPVEVFLGVVGLLAFTFVEDIGTAVFRKMDWKRCVHRSSRGFAVK